MTMFLFLSNNVSRKVGPMCARAFSSGSGSFVRNTHTTTSNNGGAVSSLVFEDNRYSSSSSGKCYSTTTSLPSGVVEQDLDSALDDLLQGTFDEVDEMDGVQTKDDSDSILKPPAEEVSAINRVVVFYPCTTAGVIHFCIVRSFHLVDDFSNKCIITRQFPGLCSN